MAPPTLADTLAAQSGHVGYACSLSQWLRDYPNAAEVVDAFADPRVSSAVLGAYVASVGGPVLSVNQIGHHRRGNCRTCPRAGFDLARRMR